MKTLIAVPCMDMVPVGFVQSLLYLEKGENISVYMKPNSLIYDSRNLISLYAIENGFDRVMWFDSDMMFTKDTLRMLHTDMDTGTRKRMVTGLYFRRNNDHTPVIFSEIGEPIHHPDGTIEKQVAGYDQYPQNTLFPVAGCGFGCVLTETSLLKDVWDTFGPAFSPLPWCGEDISFCHRVNQLGEQIWCDSRIACGHIGTFVYTEDFYLKHKEGDKD